MKSELNPKDLLPFLNDVAQNAGKIIMSYYNGNFTVQSKDVRPGGVDVVTDADQASEEYILQSIKSNFPLHDVLTEERRTENTGSKWLWVIDPLDGTVNFSHGYPVFCVSIALMEQNRIIAGIIHDPVHQETFCGLLDQGAFLNGNLIRVSSAEKLERSIVATGFPYDRAFDKVNNLAEFSKVSCRVQGMRRGGSAAMDLAYVACGRLDGFWELKLKPWDMAAGMLIVQEAGGRVTNRYGENTDIYTNSILATNGIIHENLKDLLRESEDLSMDCRQLNQQS
jgi:myo-inositol-1(or 4)-monophosphatase